MGDDKDEPGIVDEPGSEDQASETLFEDSFKEFADDKDAGGDKEPGDEPEPGKEPAPAPAPALASKSDAPFKPVAISDEIWANASDEQKRAYEAVAQRVRSDDGRQKAYQNIISDKDRRLNALERELNAMRAGKPGNGAAKPAAVPSAEALQSLLEAENWKALATDYPEVAAPLKSVVGPLLQANARMSEQLTKLQDGVGFLGATHQEQIYQRNDDLLSQNHPDWYDIAQTPEWINWVAGQPKYVRVAIERNRDAIRDVDETSNILTNYKFQAAANGSPPLGTPGASPAQTEQPQTADKRRERQLAASRTVQQQGPAPLQGAPDDFEAAFRYEVEKAERAKQRSAVNR